MTSSSSSASIVPAATSTGIALDSGTPAAARSWKTIGFGGGGATSTFLPQAATSGAASSALIAAIAEGTARISLFLRLFSH